MRDKMRTEKITKNIAFDYIGNLLTVLVSFVLKTIFIHTLGQEYLGLSGLFTNVLNVLSLAELGVGSAITFELYRPLAEKDANLLCGLMQFYRKTYCFIGWVILGLGVLLLPFLSYIIHFEQSVNIDYNLIYLLFLVNSVFSYWFNAYKLTILVASQQKYLTKKMEYCLTVIQTILQIVSLYVFRSYITYLLIGIVRSVLQNYLVAQKANQVFPFLKTKKTVRVDAVQRSRILKNTYAMSLYKISGTVLNATDNIVISTLISTNVLGCYSLYNFILTTLKSFISVVFDAQIAAVGDMNVTENEDKKIRVFNSIYFLSFVLYGCITVGMIACASTFISFWAGEQYLLRNSTIYYMMFAFFIAGLENATYIFRTGCGLYDVAKYRPVLSAIVNLAISVVLVQKIGIDGVFIGTIVSRLVTYWLIDPKVVYKHLLHRDVKEYYSKWFVYFFTVFTVSLIASLGCTYIPFIGIIGFFIRGFMSEILFLAVVLLLFRKTEEFGYLFSIGNRSLRRLLKR